MALKDGLLAEFDQEMGTTRRVLERVPDARFGWTPHAKSMTLGRLATHVAEVPGYAVPVLTASEFDIMPPGAPPYTPRVLESRDAIVALLDENVQKVRKLLQSTPDESFREPWSFKKMGQTMLTLPRIGALRVLVMNHLIHHRGQLTVYLRLNDVPLPSVYGPTADESM